MIVVSQFRHQNFLGWGKYHDLGLSQLIYICTQFDTFQTVYFQNIRAICVFSKKGLSVHWDVFMLGFQNNGIAPHTCTAQFPSCSHLSCHNLMLTGCQVKLWHTVFICSLWPDIGLEIVWARRRITGRYLLFLSHNNNVGLSISPRCCFVTSISLNYRRDYYELWWLFIFCHHQVKFSIFPRVLPISLRCVLY